MTAPASKPRRPQDDNGDTLPPHEFVDGGSGKCYVCGESESDELHELEDDNQLVGQQPTKEQSSWPGLPDDVFARLRSRYYLTQVAKKKHKPAAGKHHFVHPNRLGLLPGSAGWYGHGLCAACGKPSDTMDHEGDIDMGGSTSPSGAVAQSAFGPDPSDDKPGFQAETEVIRKNRTTKMAQSPHKFHAAEHTDKAGHQRCLLCGQAEPAGGICSVDPEAIDTPASDVPSKRPSMRGVLQNLDVASEGDGRQVSYVTSTHERIPAPQFTKPAWVPDSRGFITEINGKTMVTAQATVDPALFEKAYTPNDFFMWTQGRLVGAEEANRNGAFWTSGDLELGQATVKHGPLNWLHDGKHVIGTLAEAAFVAKPPQSAAGEDAFVQPHIAVVAPVWKWIFPEEADVIQMASDANKFWYSMECISKSVECVGDGGCGAKAEYADYIQGGPNSCQHMRERSAHRRFIDPTFLGSAVIVPPVRPGWANANAGVMAQAAAMAEKAYDQAGRPDITASEWELLMSQVLLSAQA